MSLSDELLADFEDEGMNIDGTETRSMLPTIKEEMDTEDIKPDITGGSASVKSVAKLYNSDQLNSVVESIEMFSRNDRKSVSGPVELDPEYQVIVEANQITVEIDNEISTCDLQLNKIMHFLQWYLRVVLSF